MAAQSLRDFVTAYERAHPGEVVRVTEPVMYLASGQPSPPAPITSTLARRSLRCPSTPNSGRLRWRR